MLAVLMGGRTAEEIFLGHITTGAGNDIERATDIARNMVCEWGMSNMGPLAYGKKEEAIFLGREIAQHRDFSEDTALHIDKEVKRIVSEAYEKARSIVEANRGILESIAQALLVREVLDANEVKMLMEGKTLPDKPRTPPPSTATRRTEHGPKGRPPGIAARSRFHPRRLPSQGLITGYNLCLPRGAARRCAPFFCPILIYCSQSYAC